MVLPFTSGGSEDSEETVITMDSEELGAADEDEPNWDSQPSFQQKMPLLG